MIFVDTNVFIRFLAAPTNDHDLRMMRQSTRLFVDAREGIHTLTTSDAIVAEVAFILTSARHYSYDRSSAANAIKNVLLQSRFQYPQLNTCVRALELWESHAKLSFPDALAAAFGEEHEFQLATFDQHLASLPSVDPFLFAEIEA